MVDRLALKIGCEATVPLGPSAFPGWLISSSEPTSLTVFPSFPVRTTNRVHRVRKLCPLPLPLQPLPQPMNPVCSISKTAALFQILSLITGLLVSLPPVLGSWTWDSAKTEVCALPLQPSTPHRGWVWGMAWVHRLMSALSLHGLSHRLPELPHFSKAASFFMQLV